jgi:hypothetical protein
MKLLSSRQRAHLSILARTAYNRASAGGALHEDFNQWRHAEARSATVELDTELREGFTISQCPAKAFDALKAHFEAMAGDAGKAFDTLTGPENDLRQLLHVIGTTGRAKGLHASYAAGICRRMFGHDEPTNTTEARAVLAALVKAKKKA